jgi:endonuclease YncB( thermonuclease family)
MALAIKGSALKLMLLMMLNGRKMSTMEPPIVMLNRIIALLLICCLPTFSLAGVGHQTEVEGFVVNVSDDCRLIVSIDHQAEIVRLVGINYLTEDSPEIQDARDFIRSSVLDKTVRIELLGKDPRGNILGRIYINKRCLNDTLIQAGLAEPAP